MMSDRLCGRNLAAGVVLAAALGLGVPAKAQTIHIGNTGEPDTLDPHHAAGIWEDRIIGDAFMGLTTDAPDGSVIPGIAESWAVSDDGTVYTFELGEHVWSDGVPVTAEDFAFSFRRILDPETAAKYASVLYPVKNAQAINEGALPDLDALGVRALGERTLEIALEAPTPYFLELLTHYTTFAVPRHKVEELGDDWVKPGNLVSNGAYTIEEWVPNTHVKLVKNARFHDAGNVAIDTVFYMPTEDRSAALRRFRAGELDINTDIPSDQIDWLMQNMPEVVHISPELGIYYYAFNLREPPFDDPVVRQALSMAIDREAITDKVLRTGEVPAYSFVPPGVGNYPEPAFAEWKDVPHEQRVARAKELLAEAGLGPDNPLSLTLRYNTSENHKKVAIAVAAMWKQLGVETELFNNEVKVHYNDIQEGDFQVARAGWLADYNDPQNFLFLLESTSDKLNYAGYANPEFDALMQEAARTADLARRAETLRQAEAIAMADQPYVPIYYYVSKNLVAPHVQGWVDNVKNVHRTRFLRIER